MYVNGLATNVKTLLTKELLFVPIIYIPLTALAPKRQRYQRIVDYSIPNVESAKHC